jgi:competence protein ComEC
MGIARGDAIPHLDVVFLDVGQGDATLISLPNGRHVLVDAGLRDPYTNKGVRTVLPHLRRYGIRRLDAVVLTHADADHYGGVFSVMEEIDVGQLVYNGHQKENPFWLSLLHTADSLGVPQRIVQAGDTLALDPNVRIRVLHPNETPEPFEDGNDASIVLRLEYGATSFLLTGDVEAFGESALVSRYGDLLAANVVKVAHHGSHTSSTEAFVEAASDSSTAYAIISVARRNRYDLPNEEPLARWQATSAEVLQTAHEGAVWLRSRGERIEREHWR